jgi:hypothetical protein
VRGWRLTAWAMVWPNGRFTWRCVSVCESYWVGNPQPATQPRGESCVLTPYSARHSIHANVIAPRNSDVTAAIRKGYKPNSTEQAMFSAYIY